MRITWYVAVGVRNCGGVAIIYDFANHMKALGHEVTVVLGSANKFTWFPLHMEVVYNPSRDPRWVPDADVVVFSNTKSAETIAALPISKGRKFHYVQDYEVWANTEEQIWASWSQPTTKLVAANYLKESILKNTGLPSTIVHYGMDFDVFYNENLRDNQPFTIGALYNPLPRKRFSEVIQVFQKVKKEIPDARLLLFGTEDKPQLPVECEYIKTPSKDQLRTLYSRCHAWIAMSEQEGLHIPPMEAMSCGCVLVCTDIGGMKDYAIDQKTALTVTVGDVEGAARHLLALHDDPALYRQLQTNSLAHIRDMGSRRENVVKMIDLFKAQLNTPPPPNPPDITALQKADTDKNNKNNKNDKSDKLHEIDFSALTNQKVIFYGVSSKAEQLAQFALQQGVQIQAFVDGSPRLQGMTFLGKKILAPETLRQTGSPTFDAVVITARWEKEIKQQIAQRLGDTIKIFTLPIDWS